MSDPAEAPPEDGRDEGESPTARDGADAGADPNPEEESGTPDLDALRAEVEEKYDFDDFRPADMAEMTDAEWEAAFDPDSWITGRDLLDRVEKDLRMRIADRTVFAVLERRHDPESVVAYSDEGYAIVYADGSVEGEGTVMRDVKPTVALCSMDSYEVREPPEEYELPTPSEVESGTGEFGNTMLQAVAGAQILAGLGLGGAWLLSLLPGDPLAGVPFLPEFTLTSIVAPVMATFFLLFGVFLFAIVANARLSDRFRAEEYRDRLRAAGITEGDAPEFASFEEVANEALTAARERDARTTGRRDAGGHETGETDG
ncbi:hypothetical protein HUG10_01505 [Halorarum halophilum]|uniref:DUF7319 domain-containing protein n=1 Tax=Halorarum halophilum TaxID=2743090 RepID=A0A7D5KK09_9EURY|nr:hypothetical protein [Halobaculum halophilum]QLG26295.1 hypothetical protein HUG10_01505 [Halobaculum halophilum]